MKKLLHSFTIEKEITEEVSEVIKEDGKEKTITKKKKVKKPYSVNFYRPTRRQVEEAELEYSIEMSKCIKKGIMTRAMLAKQYSDSGGLVSEEDAQKLTECYAKLLEKQNLFRKVESNKKPSAEDKKKITEVQKDIASLRREIVDLEISYNNLFNHTADVKAQNRVIGWYALNMSTISDEYGDESPFVSGDTFEEKQEALHQIEESDEDDATIIESIAGAGKDKLFTLVSFWYFSAAPTEEDFKNIDKDFDEGNV
tara:strand:- start:15181 stop:15945 length:765 start_codon:yes stop_codon:yes gene_type:complete